MRSYLEILDRMRTGPPMTEEEWDLDKVARSTRAIVEKRKLAWTPDVIVGAGQGLADSVFEAGLELACEVGLYSRSSGRVVRFEREELLEGLDRMPRSLVMGEGKDARTLVARHVVDDRPPMVWAGNPGAPTPERLFLPMVMSWMQEPIVDLVTCGALTDVDGREIRTGDPLEIVATRRELEYMRCSARRRTGDRRRRAPRSGRRGLSRSARWRGRGDDDNRPVEAPPHVPRADAQRVEDRPAQRGTCREFA